MIRVATALPLAVRRSSGWAPRTPAILITFSCLNGLVIGVSPCVCRLLTAFCFRWRDRHPHKREPQTAVRRSCAQSVITGSNGYPLGTNTSGCRRERRSAAKQGTVWGNEKVQWSGAGDKETSEESMRRWRKAQREDVRGVGRSWHVG